jgi:hypoxanthine phosphoribosyltransferase
LEYLFLSWGDIQRLSEELADKVAESGFLPDVLVAVSRGGFDPARILSDQLGVKRLASLQVVYYTGVNERSEMPEVQYPLNADVRGLLVLVVDDVADSGNSLRLVREYVEGLGAAEVRVATLHHKPWSVYRPDYYAEEVEKWIIYPWEVKESVQLLRQSLLKTGVSEEELGARLMEIGFTLRELKRYLNLDN